jgi:hypothetical protein
MTNTRIFKSLVLVLIFAFQFSNAQNKISKEKIVKENNIIEYVVDVSGVDTKQICLEAEKNIAKQDGVISFKTVGFPSKYFVLKASKNILESDLSTWLGSLNLQLKYFGSPNTLEKLISNKRKLKK